MAKARVSTNPMYTGGAGGYSFYVRGGEQVVRQRRNNSNYGETASRSESQMIRRVKWANLVNMYKACKFWMPKAFEVKAAGQTDYNLFMSMNINTATVALTKDMANNGCAVNSAQYVSRGSLPPIEQYEYDTGVGCELELPISNAITSSTTVGQFSTDFLANNPQFQEFDNLAIIMFVNQTDNRDYPYLTTVYSEIMLKKSDSTLLQNISLADKLSRSTGGRLKFAVGALNSHESGVAFIHTRKIGGSLQVSTQFIFMTGEAINSEYSYPDWVQECIQTYGLDTAVPLDPGAGGDGSAYNLYLRRTMSGNDTSLVDSSIFRLPVGHYRGTVSPDAWEVPEGVPTSNYVFALISALDAEFSSDSRVIKSWTAENMDEQGAIAPYEFDVAQAGRYYKFNIRANAGQDVEATLYRRDL